jgi:hypothetical protein
LLHRPKLAVHPQSRRPLIDGKPANKTMLVELLRAITPTLPADSDPPSIDTIQRAVVAHAFANPADDPWLSALRGWLADSIAQPLPTLVSHPELPAGWQDGPIARLTLHSVPHWFVSTRDIKAELNAYGPEAMRRIRPAMRTLGWRERKCFAWGGRVWGFAKPSTTCS